MSRFQGAAVATKAMPEPGSRAQAADAMASIGILMSDLLAGPRRVAGGPVSRASQQPINGTAGGVRRRILRQDRRRGVEIAISEHAPDIGSAATPVHHAGSEYGVVLEGGLTVEVDGVKHTLRPGDLMSYESSCGQLMWNYGGERARALWVNLDGS